MARISLLLNICVVFMIALSKSSLADDEINVKKVINCTAVEIEKANKLVCIIEKITTENRQLFSHHYFCLVLKGF